MMKFTVTKKISAQQQLSLRLRRRGQSIAMVPTMGYLHQGHQSLIRRGLREADVVVTTIFVNPTQFAPTEDLNRYPRDPQGDLKKIRRSGGQVVFMPEQNEIYPDDYETYVTVEDLTRTLEGRLRPTHFKGVTTVVTKLFNIVQPDVALFGMKDYQQAVVLKKMTRDLNWPIKFIICPTIREKDGLALSSRNSYLALQARQEATALYQALTLAKRMVVGGENRVAPISQKMRRMIRQIAPSAEIDYIAFTECDSLKPTRNIVKGTVASLAVRLGPVRLIDNMRIA